MLRLLPEEIQVYLLLKLPAKAILKCRCVCKHLCELLYNPKFIKDHLLYHKKNPKLMLITSEIEKNPICRSIDYASISSSSSSSLSRTSVTCDGAIPMDNYIFQRDWSNGIQVVGSCNGLICICISNYRFCIWNPSTCEHKLALCERVLAGDESRVRYGFGYDCSLDDYKLLRIVTNKRNYYQAEVYTFGSSSWKTLESINNRYYSPRCNGSVLLLNGAFHWPGLIEATSSNVIISFDISSERFVDFLYPEEVINPTYNNVGVLEDRLCYVVDDYYSRNISTGVWLMQDYGVSESWTKYFSFKPALNMYSYASSLKLVWSFRNGEFLIDSGYNKLLYDQKKDITKVFTIPDMNIAISQPVNYVESLVSIKGTFVQEGFGNEVRKKPRVRIGNANEVTKKQRVRKGNASEVTKKQRRK